MTTRATETVVLALGSVPGGKPHAPHSEEERESSQGVWELQDMPARRVAPEPTQSSVVQTHTHAYSYVHDTHMLAHTTRMHRRARAGDMQHL